MESLISDLKEWAQKPYREEGTLIDWFLFVGIWVVATALWVQVIKRLVD